MDAGDLLISIAAQNAEVKGGYYTQFANMLSTAASPPSPVPMLADHAATRGLEEYETAGAYVAAQAIRTAVESGDIETLDQVMTLAIPMALRFPEWLRTTGGLEE